MDYAWMAKRLNDYEELLGRCQSYRGDGGYAYTKLPEYQELVRQQPTIKRILAAIDLGLAEFSVTRDIYQTQSAVLQGLGILADMSDLEGRLEPAGPKLSAALLHPWIWSASSTFWSDGHLRQAVEEAGRALTAHTQAKLERYDISDDDLMKQAFSEMPPKESAPRLRLPGDPSTPTWKSQQRGALALGQACYQGVRNPATHTKDLKWTEQEALEYLAMFSVLARWIDSSRIAYESDTETS